MAGPDDSDDEFGRAATVGIPGAQDGEPPPAALLTTPPTSFELGERIGEGGMGRVVQARDPNLERRVAVKQLRREQPGLRSRFEHEALIAARLQHPGIVPVYEAGRDADGMPYYAMRLVAGRPLDQAADEAKTMAERLALVPALVQTADAIAYAHAQGVIHRDLKPHNVILGQYGETVVIDWGLARADNEPDTALQEGVPTPSQSGRVRTRRFGSVVGTPSYMAPEQARGEEVDRRADVYSLGATLYHVLCGAPPYRSYSAEATIAQVVERAPQSIRMRAPDTPAELATIVERAMARNREDRYVDGSALAADLRRFVDGQLVASHHYTRRERVQRWWRQNRFSAVPIAVVALLLLFAMEETGRRLVTARNRADEARQAMEKRRAEAAREQIAAEELLSRLTLDVGLHVEPLGFSDVLASLSKLLEDYYRRVPDTDGAAGPGRARALAALARSARAAGRHKEARALIERVVELHGRGGASDGEQAEAWQLLMIIADEQGELPRARLAIARAVELRWKESIAQPSAAHSLALADALREEGRIEQQIGQHAAARTRFDESKRLTDEARRLDEKSEWRESSARTHMRLAQLIEDQGAFAKAAAEYELALPDFRAAITQTPGNILLRERLGYALDAYSFLCQRRGDYAREQQLVDESLALAERVARDDATNEMLAVELAVTRGEAADVRRRRGDRLGATRLFDQALDDLDRAVTAHPEQVDWKLYFAEQLANRAWLDRDPLPRRRRAFEMVKNIDQMGVTPSDLVQAQTRRAVELLRSLAAAGSATAHERAEIARWALDRMAAFEAQVALSAELKVDRLALLVEAVRANAEPPLEKRLRAALDELAPLPLATEHQPLRAVLADGRKLLAKERP